MTLFSPHEWGNRVRCCDCGQLAEHTRCRCVGKTHGGKWRCGACGVTSSQLRRVHGNWPTDAFSRLSTDCWKRKWTRECVFRLSHLSGLAASISSGY